MEEVKNVIFVLGYPITSIGKGTFSSNIAKLFLENDSCHIVKFDGVLNKDFSKLVNDEDIRAELINNDVYGGYDFKTYKRTCSNLKFTKENLITAAQLIIKFMEDTKNSTKALRFIPDLSEFFIKELELRWGNIGKPNNLVVEVGGIIGDLENRYILHAINMLKRKNKNVSVCILTPILFNEYDDEIKTRVVQEAIQKSNEFNIDADYFLIRSHNEVTENHVLKIANVTGINKKKLVIFPYVRKEEIFNTVKNINLKFGRSV